MVVMKCVLTWKKVYMSVNALPDSLEMIVESLLSPARLIIARTMELVTLSQGPDTPVHARKDGQAILVKLVQLNLLRQLVRQRKIVAFNDSLLNYEICCPINLRRERPLRYFFSFI